MTVWRLQLNSNAPSKENLYSFCLKNNLIGVGWTYIKTHDSNEIDTEAATCANKRRANAGKSAVHIMANMELNDLIWTRINNDTYYLCRVTGLWKNREITQEHIDNHISNYVNVEWLKIVPHHILLFQEKHLLVFALENQFKK